MEFRLYRSRFSTEPFPFIVHIGGVEADPDNTEVQATFTRLDVDPVVEVFSRSAEREDVGQFLVIPSSMETSEPGVYSLRLDYAIGGVAQTFEYIVEVGQSAPTYDALPGPMRGIVESVWSRVEDTYDAPMGGPHLQVYFQTRFSRERVARLVALALGRLNASAQPFTSYVAAPPGKVFPVDKWGALLELGTWIEVLKHLIRSYTEEPNVLGVGVAREDRRDYAERWRSVLRDEQATYDDMLEHFKITHMGLGVPRVLVAGGVFGDMVGVRSPAQAGVRTRYFAVYH